MSHDKARHGPNLVGLDLSLASTGVAQLGNVRAVCIPLEPKATEYQRTRRLHRLVAALHPVIVEADLLVIEEPAFGAEHTHAHALGELAGGVKLICYQRGIRYVLVNQATLKKYALGKGGGKGVTKQAVFSAAVQRSGIGFATTDEADAWWLWQMACAHYGNGYAVDMPALNRTALAVPKWPELDKEGAVSG